MLRQRSHRQRLKFRSQKRRTFDLTEACSGAAAPECYITSYRRLLESIGPQDAEHILLSQISNGLDHGDFLVARGTLPTLVVTTTRDMFSIQGARETVRSIVSLKPARSVVHLSMVEDDAPHQSTKKNREAVYAFFMYSLAASIAMSIMAAASRDSS